MWWAKGTGSSQRHMWSRTPACHSSGGLPALVNMPGDWSSTKDRPCFSVLHSPLISCFPCYLLSVLDYFAPSRFVLTLQLSVLLRETSRSHKFCCLSSIKARSSQRATLRAVNVKRSQCSARLVVVAARWVRRQEKVPNAVASPAQVAAPRWEAWPWP